MLVKLFFADLEGFRTWAYNFTSTKSVVIILILIFSPACQLAYRRN